MLAFFRIFGLLVLAVIWLDSIQSSGNKYTNIARIMIFFPWIISGYLALKNGKTRWAGILIPIALFMNPFLSVSIGNDLWHFMMPVFSIVFIVAMVMRPWGKKKIELAD